MSSHSSTPSGICLFCEQAIISQIHIKARKFCNRAHYVAWIESPEGYAKRFWSWIQRGSPESCWPHLGSPHKDGYRKFGAKRAHRVAWELTFGPVPDGLQVLHSCDNPPCCNPGHLFLGTQLENMHDKIAKGRGRYAATFGKGEKHPQAKFAEAQVREIRRRRAEGERVADLAKDFGRPEPTIRSICGGYSWKHIL